MASLLRSAWARFRRDEGGNVFVLFGATAIPLLLLMGGAVDMARHARYKADLANAVDAAALALARQGENFTEGQAKAFVESYVAGFGVADGYFTVGNFNVTKTDNGFIVSVDGSMRTMFLPLGDVSRIGADIVAEVVHSSNQVELALVLDNTGSMNCGATTSGYCTGNWNNPGSSSRIAGLKRAAGALVDTLMTDEDFIKIAVVPFEGAVNVKNDSLDYSWLDWEDTPQAKYNGANFDDVEYEAGGGEECYWYRDWRGRWRRRCEADDETTSQEISHKWLFDQLHDDDSDVEWAGCVEMRAEPYDILDTTPDSSNPDTLFVPFFWPDEPDDDNNDRDYYSNDYLDDTVNDDPEDAQRYANKYLPSEINWHWGKKDTTFPYESGPNYGCPRPILPLTNDKQAVEQALDDMIAYPAMGTFIPAGLVWGWHALTPNAPLTEGISPDDDDYEKTVKAIVLLTDGENSVTEMSNHNYSLFSGYNYTGTEVDGHYRLGSRNAPAAQAHLDTKTRTLCTSIKDAGFRLYTITFGDIPNAARTLMRNCATDDDGETLYYHAPSNEELEDVFHSIGEDLSEIHLSM
jgi:hypothetical protein